MIKLNDKVVDIKHFPDGTLLMKEFPQRTAYITWLFDNNEELVALIYLVRHLKQNGCEKVFLNMPYVPNARQDRVKTQEDVFTLKYFSEVINYLGFENVSVLDAHSSVSEALIDRVVPNSPCKFIEKAIEKCEPDMLFFPDEGSQKRYSDLFEREYAFGIKKRDWATGKILGLDVAGCVDEIKGSKILIIDDICSRGGTFYFSAKKLKELGAKEVYLYVTHCENTIFEGEIFTSGLIEKVYTTNSILRKTNEKIEVFEL